MKLIITFGNEIVRLNSFLWLRMSGEQGKSPE